MNEREDDTAKRPEQLARELLVRIGVTEAAGYTGATVGELAYLIVAYEQCKVRRAEGMKQLETVRTGYRSMVETIAAMVTAATGDKRSSGDPIQIVRDLRERYEQAIRRGDVLAREAAQREKHGHGVWQKLDGEA